MLAQETIQSAPTNAFLTGSALLTRDPPAPVVSLRWKRAALDLKDCPDRKIFIPHLCKSRSVCDYMEYCGLGQAEPMVHISSQHCIQWHSVGSLQGWEYLHPGNPQTTIGLFSQRAGC